MLAKESIRAVECGNYSQCSEEVPVEAILYAPFAVLGDRYDLAYALVHQESYSMESEQLNVR